MQIAPTHELPFQTDTFRERIEQAQAYLRTNKLDAALLFDPENVYYLTGYQSIGYFTFQTLLLPMEGQPILISRAVNQYLAAATPTIADFVPIRDTDDPAEVLLSAVRRYVEDSSDVNLGLEMAAWYLTADMVQNIQSASKWQLSDVSGSIEQQRVVKSDLEITRTRQAARAAEAGLQAAIAVLEPGVTENQVAAAMLAASINEGSEYLGHAPLVASGPRSARCFATWKRRSLAQGDTVFLEAAGCIDRYHAMLARTAVLGKPGSQLQHVSEVLIEALEAAIASVRPGATAGEVDQACRSVIERFGYGEQFVHRTGYGAGIGFPPNWSEGKALSLRPNDATVLTPGMVFHIVPTIFMSDFGACFSETVLVTNDGVEVITNFPRELVVV